MVLHVVKLKLIARRVKRNEFLHLYLQPYVCHCSCTWNPRSFSTTQSFTYGDDLNRIQSTLPWITSLFGVQVPLSWSIREDSPTLDPRPIDRISKDISVWRSTKSITMLPFRVPVIYLHQFKKKFGTYLQLQENHS